MQQLLLLHGALGSAEQLEPLSSLLKDDCIVHRICFSGHGGSSFPDEPFSIQLFARQVLEYMAIHQIGQADLFGYSMGGYVALYLAKYHPQQINRVITLATKFYWDEATASKEVLKLDAVKIEEKLPSFAAALKERHGNGNWKLVLQKTADMLTAMGQQNPLQLPDYKKILNRVLLMLGDGDKMVTLQETQAVAEQLPNARLAVLPETPHPIEMTDPDRLATEIKNFLV